MHFASVAALATLTFSSTISAAALDKRAAPAAPAGYSTVFLDDFTGSAGAAPSSSNWIIDKGTQYAGGPSQWGTGEVETFTSNAANVKLSGAGGLALTPMRDSKGAWTSGRIETVRADFMAPAGKKMLIRARILLPNITPANGAGIWAAFWTLGNTLRQNRQGWPGVGEFDIMESVNGGANIYSTVHCGVNPGGPCNEPNGLGAARTCPNKSCLGSWHTYAVEVDRSSSPEKITFKVDGSVTKVVTSANINNATVWANTVHVGHFVVFDVAVGGSFPNALAGGYTPTSKTISGASMRVDWVGVYYST